jgi:hypothetical protein
MAEEMKKRLQYLRVQRCREKDRISELQQTSGIVDLSEYLSKVNYWQGMMKNSQNALDSFMVTWTKENDRLKIGYNYALEKLDAAKKGESNSLKLHKIRLERIVTEIEDIEANLQGKQSKNQERLLAIIEDSVTKQMMTEAAEMLKARPPPATTPVITKKVKVAKKAKNDTQMDYLE